MDFTQMLGQSQQPIQQTAPQPGFAGVTQPTDPTVAQIATPATNPAEVQERAGLWQQVAQRFQTDPSLRQAMMMMGAHLAQPNQPGETTLGHIGQSVALGGQVYNAGEYTKYEQQRQASEDLRKQKESESTIALQGAQTQGAVATAANTKAGTPGVAARAQVDVNTVEAQTQKAQSAAQQAATDAANSKFALDKATSQEEVDKINRENEKRAATIKASVPDKALQKAALAEVEAAGLKAEEATARIAASRGTAASGTATARVQTAAAKEKELEGSDLAAMTPEQRIQYRARIGDYSPQSTVDERRINALGKMYDQLPTNDPARMGKNKAQFVAAGTKQFQQKDFLESYAKLAANLSPQELQESGLTDLLHEVVASKKGATAPAEGGAATGVQKWKRDPKTGKPVLAQ